MPKAPANNYTFNKSFLCKWEKIHLFSETRDLFLNYALILLLRTLVDNLKRLCKYVIEQKKGIFHWLFAVPLLHFLSKSVVPFSGGQRPAAPSSLNDNNWWGADDLFDFFRVRRQVLNARLDLFYTNAL